MLIAGSELVLSRVLERQGYSRRWISRLVESGTHVRLRPGVLVATSIWQRATPDERHRLRIRALQATAAGDPVFSHWSAAALHGLPLLRRAADLVDVSVPPGRSRNAAGIRSHVAEVGPADLETIDGVLCTSFARTVIDIAAASDFAEAVVVADAALRRLGPNGPAVLAEGAARCGRRRGAAKIARVLAFADGRSGSPAESVSRVTMSGIGVPKPELQFRVHHETGDADLDFYFPHERVGGEVDGDGKYTDPAMSGGLPAAVFIAEKDREDRVRDQGIRMVRWGWRVARSRVLLAQRLAIAGVLPVR